MQVIDADLFDYRKYYQREIAVALLTGQKKEKREDPKAKRKWYKNTSRHKLVARSVASFVNRLSQLIPVEFASGSLCSVISLILSIFLALAGLGVGFYSWGKRYECNHGRLDEWLIVAGLFHCASGWLAFMRWFVSSSILLSFTVDKIRQHYEGDDVIGDEESEGPKQFLIDDGLSTRTPAEKQQRMFNNFAWYFDVAIFFMSILLIGWYIVGVVWVGMNYDYDEQSDCNEVLYVTALTMCGIFVIKAIFLVPWVVGWCGFCWFIGCFCFWETTILRGPFWARTVVKAIYSLFKTCLFCTCCPSDGEKLFDTYFVNLNPICPAACLKTGNLVTKPFELSQRGNTFVENQEAKVREYWALRNEKDEEADNVSLELDEVELTGKSSDSEAYPEESLGEKSIPSQLPSTFSDSSSESS